MWITCFSVSLLVLLASAVTAIHLARREKHRSAIMPLHVVFAGVALAAFFALLPPYSASMEAPNGAWEAFLFALHHTFQVFTLDADRAIILENIPANLGALSIIYPAYLSLLIVVGPLLTFSFLLSFFRNVSAYGRFITHYFQDVYVFSELNDRALALAKDIRHSHHRALIIFTDVFNKEDEQAYELIRDARKIGGLCFKRDIADVNFKLHSQNSQMYFFTIGMDESENISQSLQLMQTYGQRENSYLFAFSTRIEAELLLTKAKGLAMKVRRIDDVRSLIYRLLYDQGVRLFQSAKEAENGLRTISAVIIGMGLHGTEMMKALSWYCQMDGYYARIDAFDMDELAADRFTAKCPELMIEGHNGVSIPGEAEYKITLHPGRDVTTKAFVDDINALPDATYVLVSLGADELNIRTAVELRMLFERRGLEPIIQAIVYDPKAKEALNDVQNYNGQPYNIELIGDLESSYSENVILNSELEKEALNGHMQWGPESDFWQFEYNYRSSSAAAIHRRARRALGIAGMSDRPDTMDTKTRDALEQLEHRRWNAYMRSEGYVYAPKRNDLAKTHYDLVSYYDLKDEEEKRKDSAIGTA